MIGGLYLQSKLGRERSGVTKFASFASKARPPSALERLKVSSPSEAMRSTEYPR